MALRPEKPSNLVRRPSTRSIVGVFERVLTVSRNLQEKTGELASKLKVLEARVHEIRPSINPSLALAIDAAVRGDEKAQKIVRESESKVPLCQKRAVAAYTAASHSLFRVLADTAALEETKTECALLVSQALSLFQVVEGKQNPNTIDRPSISEIVKSVKGLETRQEEEEEEEEEEKEKAMPFPRLSRKKAKHGLSAPLHAKGKSRDRGVRNPGGGDGMASNRLSTNSRSSQRTDNAGDSGARFDIVRFERRLVVQQARLQELGKELKELEDTGEIPDDVLLIIEDVVQEQMEFEDAIKEVAICDLKGRLKRNALRALRIASDMKEARAKIGKTEGKIEEFESGGGEEGESNWHFSGSVWESLGCALPEITHDPSLPVSNTNISNTDNYLFAPKTVQGIDWENFMAYCADKGYLEKLQQESTNESVGDLLERSMRSLYIKSESSVGLCFSQVFQAVISTLDFIPKNLRYTSDKSSTGGLRPDFIIGTVRDGVTVPINPLLVGELKSYSSDSEPFYFRWCERNGHDPEQCPNRAHSERHTNVSPIRQLYNYMVDSGKFVGVYSHYGCTAAFFRDCKGTLVTTPMLPDDSAPMSVPQLLALVIMIAMSEEVPEFYDGERPILVPCEGTRSCKGVNHHHTSLPDDCKWAKGDLKRSAKPRTGATAMRRAANKSLYKKHDTPITWGDLYNCKYISDCYTGNAVECEIMGERAVVKYNDFGDHEDADERLDQIDFEAEVYANLSDLQGDCIPKYLGHGSITDTDGSQYGFATSYAGESLSYESLDSLTEEFKTSVKDALDKIHARGVLHGDLRLPNILKSKDDPEKAVFIDFSHSGIYDDPDGQFFQSLAKYEKENLVKLLKGEKIKQVF